MFKFIQMLFKRTSQPEVAQCEMCKIPISEGEVYGHDNEPGNLALCGYYFCASCVGRQHIDRINEEVLGKTYIISDSQQRYRVTICK